MPRPPFAAVMDRIDRVSQSMLADALANWIPSSGEPACEGVGVLFSRESVDAFSGKRMDAIKYLLSDLPGLRKGECISVVRGGVAAEYEVGNTDLLTATRGIAYLNSRREVGA